MSKNRNELKISRHVFRAYYKVRYETEKLTLINTSMFSGNCKRKVTIF